MSRPATIVYTDGACQGNPGPGGWAWAVPGGPYASGAEGRSTNQRMEIRAVLEAVSTLSGPLEVVSDSTYVVNCFRDRWWEGWLARGWLNSAKKPVANRDLWEPLVDAYRAEPTRLRFRWVKGHGGDPMNDLVDRLAVQAAAAQAGRRGDGPPDDLGPADAAGRPGTRRSPVADGTGAGPGAAGAEADGILDGHLVLVGGLKPPGLGGYGDNPVASKVRARLIEVLSAMRTLHPDLRVLTGLGLGAEQLGAEAAAAAGVPYVGVLAFPGQEAVWSPPARRRFSELLASAAAIRTLQSKQPDGKRAVGAALSRRDAWLARTAGEALVVWDRTDPAVGTLVRSLEDHLGEEQVWVLEP